MNDYAKMRRYYESKLDGAPDVAPQEALIKSSAASTGLRPMPIWETVFGLLVTIGYLMHFLNPYHWFSVDRSFLVLMNGLSFGRFIWGFGIGF